MTKTVTLGEICNILSGFAFDSELFNDSEGMPLIRIRDVGKNQTDTFYSGTYSKRYVIEQGDMLIGMDGDFRIAEWRSVPALLNQRVCKLEPNTSQIDSKFLLHFLPKKLKQIEDATSFATVKHLSVKGIQAISIPLPPLPEQRRIAALLDRADALRQKDRQLLAHYDKLAQSIFMDLFGDPVKNEKGWEIKKFGTVGKLDRGVSKHRPRNAPKLLGGIHPLIQTGDVSNADSYLTKYKNTYSDIGLKQSKMWKAETLCITIAANIAKTAILKFDACFPDSVVGFLPYELQTNNEYVRWWLSFLQKILEDSAPESAQKNINLEILRNLEIPIPPLPLQTHFAQFIEQIERQKVVVRQQMAASEVLFGRLLQESFG